MLGFIRSLFRKPEPPPAAPLEPIERGEVWRLKGEDGDPFPPKDGVCDVVILDYKDGWVRYSMNRVFKDNRMQEDSFRRCYRKLPYETTSETPC